MHGKTILVVDDEVDLREIIVSELQYLGAEVHGAENIASALEIINRYQFDLILSDIRMPGGTGIDLLDKIRNLNTQSPSVILITGFADITTEVAFDKGAVALVSKPFVLDELMSMVVRYSSPLNERLKSPMLSKESIAIRSVDETQIFFGQGGLATFINSKERRISSGDTINFEFELSGKEFNGQGVCRWIRSSGAGQSIIGIEILSLTDASLGIFKELSHGKISYIPSFVN